jgi:hypothetical protein
MFTFNALLVNFLKISMLINFIAGMFYWMRSLQTYDNGWNYMDNLKNFVRGGMVDETFIDSVSGIVNRVSILARESTYICERY